jgi:hypothetical protein
MKFKESGQKWGQGGNTKKVVNNLASGVFIELFVVKAHQH